MCLEAFIAAFGEFERNPEPLPEESELFEEPSADRICLSIAESAPLPLAAAFTEEGGDEAEVVDSPDEAECSPTGRLTNQTQMPIHKTATMRIARSALFIWDKWHIAKALQRLPLVAHSGCELDFRHTRSGIERQGNTPGK